MNDFGELRKEVYKKGVKELPKKINLSNQDMVCNYIGDVNIGNVIHQVYLTDWKFQSGEFGHIILEANKIYLSKQQSPHNLLVTLIHEIMHRILREYQLHRLVADSTNVFQIEESIVETLDTPLCNDLLLSEINFKMFRRILSGEFSEKE